MKRGCVAGAGGTDGCKPHSQAAVGGIQTEKPGMPTGVLLGAPVHKHVKSLT